MFYRILKIYVVLFVSFIYAEQNIEIIGGGGSQLPSIAVIDFINDKSINNDNIASIIANDFSITGEFRAKNYNNNYLVGMIENKTQTNYLISGSIIDGNINFKLQSNDESKTVLISGTISDYNNLRQVAHTISNQIYKQLTNTIGVFNTKIIFSAYDNVDKKYKIIVSDYDGYNQKPIYTTKNILGSIAVRPNGSQIAYTEIINHKPQIYVQNLYATKDKNQRYLVASFSGSNSSPAFSTDGNQLLITSTNDDGSHISLIDNSIYNEDSYKKDIILWGDIATEADIGYNEGVVFSSNHDGGAQVFMTNLNNLQFIARRLTLDVGNYNVTPRLSHDTNSMIFIHREGGNLKLYYTNFLTNSSYPITKTNYDLSPSFAINDKLILYTSDNYVYIVNKNGTISTKLKNINFSKIIDIRWSSIQ